MKTWLTVAEGAEYSGVSRDTIYTACERGELSHARIGGRRAIRLKREWIDAWLERHTRGARCERGENHGPMAVTEASRYSDARLAGTGMSAGDDSVTMGSRRPMSGPLSGCSDGCRTR